MKRTILLLVGVLSFIAVDRLGWQLLLLRSTSDFKPGIPSPVLVVCSDHIEVTYWNDLNGVTQYNLPPGCTFQVTHAKQVWVQESVKTLPTPRDGSFWVFRVKQINEEHQRIDFEIMRDGFAGMIYDVTDNRVTPLKSRMVGPGGAFMVLMIDVFLWAACWVVGWLAWTWWYQRHRVSP